MNVYIVGTSGSGKTTLAKRLSNNLSLTHIELDAYLFHENWQPRPKTEFRKTVMAAAENQHPFVMCGNYSTLMMRVLPMIDVVIWLDYPLYKVLYRVFMRTMRRLLTKEPCCGDNFEIKKNVKSELISLI